MHYSLFALSSLAHRIKNQIASLALSLLVLAPFNCQTHFSTSQELSAYNPRSVPSLPPVRMLQKSHQTSKNSKVLFIVPWLIAGGMERAFISMINNLPIPLTQVDVCILKRGGAFEKLLPKSLKIIPLHTAEKNQYDTVISYAQWIDPSLWIPTISAKNRIQWIHSDVKFDATFKYFKKIISARHKIDHYICVSKQARSNLAKLFPKVANKARLVMNIIDNEAIRNASLEPISETLDRGAFPTVITVARLTKEKRIDLAIRAHKYLKDRNIDFKWYVIGDGKEKQALQSLINKLGLKHSFILLGERSNPYPYIKQADIFGFTSESEGFGLVLTEAKILGKPILVTDFKAAHEQVEHERNGLIVKGNVKDVALGLKQLLKNSQLRNYFESNVSHFEFDNSPSLSEIEHLIVPE